MCRRNIFLRKRKIILNTVLTHFMLFTVNNTVFHCDYCLPLNFPLMFTICKIIVPFKLVN